LQRILGGNFYFIANSGTYNLEDGEIIDPAKLDYKKAFLSQSVPNA
jgi:hypothetical protein